MDNLEEMDRSLEKFNLPRLNQEEIEIMNNPITSTEIETVIKKKKISQKTKAQDQMASQENSIIQRRANIYLSKTLSKNQRGRNTFKLILQGHHHPDTETKDKTHKKTL